MEDTQQTVRVRLCQTFGDRVRERVALAALTTFRTGGPADWMLETSDLNDLVAAVRATRALGLPLTVMGGGSNVLVGDGGVTVITVTVAIDFIADAIGTVGGGCVGVGCNQLS